MPTKLLLCALCALACAEPPEQKVTAPTYAQFTVDGIPGGKRGRAGDDIHLAT